MNPRWPIYIVSKGRADSRLTSRALERMRVPYSIVVEAQERDAYAAVIDPQRVLVLDPAYQQRYDTCDDLGATKSKGPGPARNFAWDHAVSIGAAWHWVMDDNLFHFGRYTHNRKALALDGAIFAAMEDFCDRYTNVMMAGPAYEHLTPALAKNPPFVANTRIYSCNLIRNDAPYRWRGRYNEDTDLSLRMLKDGWCTVQFNAFLQHKCGTQVLKGGNTKEFYAHEGTTPKSEMQVRLHPDVSRVLWRFGRVHHYVDYSGFKPNKLQRKPDAVIAPGVDEYGMVRVSLRQRMLGCTKRPELRPLRATP